MLADEDIDALFRSYGPLVYNRARQLLGNPADAEEATQEVFLKILENSRPLQGEARPAGWLYRVTTNHCLNRLRDRTRRKALRERRLAVAGDDTAASPRAEPLVLLRRLLADADEDCARAAVYVHLDDMSHAEVARLLGVSRRTVGNLVERFRSQAAALLGEGEGEGQ